MLYPSIDSLLEKLDSKYSLVTVSSRRAREMKEVASRVPLATQPKSYKFVGLALEEIVQDRLTHRVPSQDEMDNKE
ncbi:MULTISPECIES: DNA-directed RNA polymerase subunit omega [Shouchella]|uniref:DNA-directed RNA polymerase subunit omega n=3 Tax=Bacillaceae TaxID=186817 RepID=A0A060LUH1_9BACI|nr:MULTISPECIES: DNA-directed RNA polymerase subunit omega [Bacillaceae]RQW20725.1 DNA-directed RNA polymerase subunit omega [Bacillus sp. C1-1]AIC94886.1 DNA-directed RNA polymerase subunit omega [Shouchella lehensis G1]KQL58187.1 DNA-directed RNA polymerase subunit omega [Alkalicoccobacillus plakortidis]MBG9784263.1 DNA-directed RNA polymerase subunit omega [Shouchella lehensis]TES50747.1 DNA-directed RNA polymerase subunit omega [Shouchella lehensis]